MLTTAVLLLPFLLIFSTKTESSSICKHQIPSIDEIPHPVRIIEDVEGKRLFKRESRSKSTTSKLRIRVFFDKSVDDLDEAKRKIVKDEVVPEAVSYWEKVLRIKGKTGKIRMNRKCENNQYFLAPDDPTQYCKNRCVTTKCGEVRVPDEHLDSCHTCNSNGRSCELKTEAGEGVDNADFVLYVSTINTRQCGSAIGDEASTVAYAAHCQQEDLLDRPVSGHTNICPEAVDSRSVAGLISTLQHELLHALAFSSSLFAYYRDKDGNPLTERRSDGLPPINRNLGVRQWSDRIIKQVRRPWKVRKGVKDRRFNLLVTPKVVEEVRKHFNCSKLEGAELEDQGGDGTALTHWEKRLFQNEAMTGTVHTANPIYSRMTFAILEDSGWYEPDYSLAQDLHWGNGWGCDFALNSCMEILESNAVDSPFCDTMMESSDSQTECTSDGLSVGSCNMATFARDIPEIYQNFKRLPGVNSRDIARVGGSVTLADFCPFVQEFTWRSEAGTRETRCTEPGNSPPSETNYALESYGSESKCFLQSGQWEQKSCSVLKTWKRFGAGCYNYECKDKMLHIVVRNVTLTCEEEGQVLEVSLTNGDWLHQGTILCPRCEDYCGECDPEAKAKIDPDTLKEDENCLEDSSIGIKNFLKNIGLDLG